ncbi:hypothetical protein [Candidatus Galacturonibacter soehngenii]|uniref:Uncharacterized protein n=1 Tax=Candidatus Galacturonatibacter soehngenii TaxID=2307010 RepID=A0A7V7QJF2_9FIRM|nr:hypothetical protein [Candidatus Galacturonibacter soehngenii]KAB1437772.1 hypothetical protein F7O84_09255 [Candidatus Galacturonibacter soehngenii]
MNNKKHRFYRISLVLFILLSFVCQMASKTDTCVGQKLTIYYVNHLIVVKDDNQMFYQSRDFLCHRKVEKEVLSKSKKDKIRVTQPD